MGDLVVKENRLIEASYTLGLAEQRLMLMGIAKARDEGIKFTSETCLTVSATEYAECFGVTKQAAHKALKEAAETLFNRYVTITEGTEITKTRWVSMIKSNSDPMTVSIYFATFVIPFMANVIDNPFTKYQLKHVENLTSIYAIRLYELMIKWRDVGVTQPYEIEKLRALLGVELHEYTLMKNFKARVLDQAIKQINEHTDIKADYEQIKSGRTITHLKFKFKFKEPKRFIPPTNEQIDKMKGLPLGETYDQVRERLKREWADKNKQA